MKYNEHHPRIYKDYERTVYFNKNTMLDFFNRIGDRKFEEMGPWEQYVFQQLIDYNCIPGYYPHYYLYSDVHNKPNPNKLSRKERRKNNIAEKYNLYKPGMMTKSANSRI